MFLNHYTHLVFRAVMVVSMTTVVLYLVVEGISGGLQVSFQRFFFRLEQISLVTEYHSSMCQYVWITSRKMPFHTFCEISSYLVMHKDLMQSLGHFITNIMKSIYCGIITASTTVPTTTKPA